MTVYAVWSGDYEDVEVDAIFSTSEGADDYIARHYQAGQAWIESYELDHPAPKTVVNQREKAREELRAAGKWD